MVINIYYVCVQGCILKVFLVLSSSAKHLHDSPSYSTIVRSRSPRLKEPELVNRERRQRRSPESSPTEAKRKTPALVMRRRDNHSPQRGRSRDRKVSTIATNSSIQDTRGKGEKLRDRLFAEPGYLVRPRSPVSILSYREPYPVRDLSPSALSYRDRPRTEPYDNRRGYSPQSIPLITKFERKEDMYDSRSRRPVSPDLVRCQLNSRAKDYPDYEHEWSANLDQGKIPDWDQPEYRRRNRPLDGKFSLLYSISFERTRLCTDYLSQ